METRSRRRVSRGGEGKEMKERTPRKREKSEEPNNLATSDMSDEEETAVAEKPKTVANPETIPRDIEVIAHMT